MMIRTSGFPQRSRSGLLGVFMAVLLTFTLVGCRASGSGNAPPRHRYGDGPLLSASEGERAVRLAREFWHAAAANDTTHLRRIVIGERADDFATSWRRAYPTFFDSTKNHVEYRWGYYVGERRDTVIAEIFVPFNVCRDPNRPRDRYHVRILARDTSWKMLNVWRGIC